jgi:predicted metal-dependent enzyme (double-stranded beta helix superfamily)
VACPKRSTTSTTSGSCRSSTPSTRRPRPRRGIPALLEDLHDPFCDLLTDDEWLPERYRDSPPEDYEDNGEMGRDVAQWLRYRRENDLVVFSPVIPPEVETPVHDHLAWGLVGRYGGTQWEEFFRRTGDGDADAGPAELELIREQEQGEGDFYELVPPDNDIQAVETTSDEPSVSIHLLGTDVGCIQRHAFDTDADFVELFQSHYTNVRCETTKPPGEVDHGHGHGH